MGGLLQLPSAARRPGRANAVRTPARQDERGGVTEALRTYIAAEQRGPGSRASRMYGRSSHDVRGGVTRSGQASVQLPTRVRGLPVRCSRELVTLRKPPEVGPRG